MPVSIVTTFPLRIAPDLREWLEREAQCRGGLSLNATIVQCLEEARLRRETPPGDPVSRCLATTSA